MTIRWYIVHAIRISREGRRIHQGAGRPSAVSPTNSRKCSCPRAGGRGGPSRPQINSERSSFPGYVLVKCDPTDQITIHQEHAEGYGLWRRQQAHADLGEAEADRIKGRSPGVERPKIISQVKSATVRVADGPFASFNGKVEAGRGTLAPQRSRCRDLRRETPVELEFGQVEKV